MSQGEQPYNSLGQIIAQGGEIALGLAIANNWSETQIAALFARRFEPMTSDDRQRLIDIANAAINAARSIDLGDPLADINPLDIPTIDPLFGLGGEGLRARFIGRVDFTGTGEWRNIWVDLADIGSIQDLVDAITSKAKEYAEQYPERFGINQDADTPEPVVDLMFAAKAF